jgi:glycosyltransferase involved in cell wall biosynthesis
LTLQGVAVCIAGGGADELRNRTLVSVRAHTTTDVRVLELKPGDDPFAAAARDDVVVVQPGCVVASGWLDGLQGAARASSTTATATALTQHDLDAPIEADTFERAAATVRARSPRLRPRISLTNSPCVYVRRSALDLVGGGQHFWPGCVERGLAHVLADDVLVLDPRPAPPRTQRPSMPLARAFGAARRAVHGLSVAIDATILYGPTTGTHVHVLELIAGLARAEHVRLTAILPDQPSEHARDRLQGLPELALVTYEEAAGKADVVHRPFQLISAGDLTFLESLGERLVLTQQDLIAFHNPAYFPTKDAWEEYRELTRVALAAADRVVFFSAHARDDALAEELVVPARASVVHLGVDHPLAPGGHAAQPAPPPGARRLGDGVPAILCLGTDFHHKNRLFALRLVERLKTRHGWDGVLVFAGPPVAYGSSRPQEAAFLSDHASLADSVLDVGPVSEAEKEWLFARSALVVYPSVLEGFGLVPFEAAAHGVPCLWAPGSSLSELLPDDAAGIVPWDAERSAEPALALMQDEDARKRNLEAIGAAASGLTWDATAAGLLDVYRATADAPASAGATTLGSLSEDAARLVGPGGALPADVQRPLLALATHRRIATPVFDALKLGYRASYRLRRAQRRK